MNRTLAICVAAMLGVLVAGFLILAFDRPAAETGQVTVRGEARTEVVPDMLTVRVSVEATDMDLGTARDSVTRRVNAALDAIRAAGVVDTDLRALGIQVHPVHDWVDRRQVFRGHRVSRGIEFRLRDLDAWPSLVEDLLAARIDNIQETTPGRSDADRLRREALRDAVADAEARATVLADASGTRLGAVQRIQQLDAGFAVPRMEMMRAATADAAQWEAGTITISASVDATYTLERR